VDGGSSNDGVVYKYYPGGPQFNYAPAPSQAAYTATLNATVIPNGTNTSAYFQLGPNNSSYTMSSTPQVLGSGSAPVVVSATFYGLNASTIYYYQVVVSSSTYGTFYGGQKNLTTLNIPNIYLGPALNITNSTATLTGTVNPQSEDTQVFFLYGPTTAYGYQSGSAYLGNSTDNTAVNLPVSGLNPNTLYHYLIETTGSAGVFYSTDGTFSTNSSNSLIVETGPPLGLGSFGVTLSGTVNPNGAGASVWFQYGLTSSYTGSTPAQYIGNSTTAGTVLAAWTGLQPDTQYHYALSASSGGLMETGSDVSFTTPPVNPGITENAAGGITYTGASLSGTVNPGGLDAQVYFLYGLSGTYGMQTAAVDIGNGTTPISVSALLSSLTAGTKYHYEMVVTNTDGVYYGGDQVFITGSAIGSTPVLTGTVAALKGATPPGVPGTAFSVFNPPIVNAGGHVAFLATLVSGTATVSKTNSTGIWAADTTGTLQLIARTSGSAAGMHGASYSTLSDPVYNDDSEVAFLAGLKLSAGSSSGIFTNVGGTLGALRVAGDHADGLASGITFTGFKAMALTHATLLFQATIAGTGIKAPNNTGLWVTDFASGNTQLVAQTGGTDPVTHKTIKTLTVFTVLPVVSGQSRITDATAGNIAYVATYSDGSSAVIKATWQ
jgi:hypothetical protein